MSWAHSTNLKNDPTRDCNPPPSQERVQRPTLAHLDEAKEKPRGDRESTTTSNTTSIQKMQVRFTTYIDPYHFALNVSPKHQKEFLIELFKIFYSEHVIEAYKEVQQRNPDLFPPLLEKQ